MARRVKDLKRRRPIREPKRRFILVCEGAKTEPTYFAAIRRACSGALVAVETVSGVGGAMTVANRAREEAKTRKRGRAKRDSFEDGDRVWAVFDRDDHHHFDEAVALCEGHGIGVARSDPCFELWLILHEREHDRPCSPSQAQKELASLHPEYDRHGAKKVDCDDLVNRVEEAEERAEAQLRCRTEEGAPFGNPSTTVGCLTREIREAAALFSPSREGV